MAGPETFVPLDAVTPLVVRDFTTLLSELSTSFAKMDEEAQRYAIYRNLSSALDSPTTTVLVHRDRETGYILATATGNTVLGAEGWVDDVVTLEAAQRRGLGRAAMQGLHRWFEDVGMLCVRLTSRLSREKAGNLYSDMGYVERGKVWRAPLTAENSAPTMPGHERDFSPIVCPIPTGSKPWIYGPRHGDGDAEQLEAGIRAAHSVLAKQQIGSANYFAEQPPRPDMAAALQQTGYRLRDTRLYTLNLR